MKILKIFGVVVGIHVFALVMIFANPGCSSTHQSNPSTESIARNEGPAPAVSVPPAGGNEVSPVAIAGGESPVTAAPPFDPNAPALSSPSVRFSPTRPGTPAAAALEAEPVAGVTPASTYTVGKGDSLWTIAKKHHISISDLAAANSLKASATVRLGQKLIIPAGKVAGATGGASAAERSPRPSAASDVAPAPRRASGDSVKHVVKPGETLGGIARRYQVKVGEVATANNITDPARIRPGMELVIPGWQAPSGRSSRRSSAPASAPAVAEPAPAQPQTPATETPTIVTPAPEVDLDAGLNKTSEAPVIKVDGQ